MAGVTPLNSSLVALETSPPSSGVHIDHQHLGRPSPYLCCRATELESTFRHSGWADRRRKVYDALMRTGQSDNRLHGFANCGSALYVAVERGTGTARLTANTCHDRFCVVCGRTKATVIVAATKALIARQTTRFVTLTLRASNTPLVDQLNRLTRDFTVLRRRQFWREHVTGGASFLEVKVGKNSGLWHCHLHCLVAGDFIPQKELAREWHSVTGDSFIVDVRECSDPDGRARYVTKYVTKPADSSVFSSNAKLDEFVVSMKGRRLCNTFGNWRGTPLDPSVPEDGEWKTCGSLETVMTRAAAGCPVSLRLLLNLSTRYPGLPALVDYFDSRRGRPADGPRGAHPSQ